MALFNLFTLKRNSFFLFSICPNTICFRFSPNQDFKIVRKGAICDKTRVYLLVSVNRSPVTFFPWIVRINSPQNDSSPGDINYINWRELNDNSIRQPQKRSRPYKYRSAINLSYVNWTQLEFECGRSLR